MTPQQLFELPTQRSDPWWHAGSELDAFVGETNISDRIDARAAELAGGGPVFDTKLCLVLDNEDALTYVTVSQDGRLLAILVRTGDDIARAITDFHGWEAARDLVRSFEPHDRSARGDVVEPDEELGVLTANYGCRTVTVGGEVRLVREEHCDAAGRALLDESAFRGAFHDGIRSAFAWDEGLARGVTGLDARRAVADALRGALVGADASFVADHEMKVERGRFLKVGWVAAVARTDEGTYAVGLSTMDRDRRGLNWLDGVAVARMGDRDLYARLEAEHAVPEPTSAMFEI